MVLKKDILIQHKNDQGEVEVHYPITKAENIDGLEEKISEKVAGDGYISIKEKGAAGGVASLGVDGKVPAKQLPEMDYDAKGSAVAVEQKLDVHKGDKANPHGVTKAQVGLGNVDNTSDVNKPVSAAQKTAIDAVEKKADKAKETADEAKTAAGNAQGTANKKAETKVYTAMLTTAWTGSNPYAQTVAVSGITASMTPIIDVVLSDTASTAKTQIEAWACVGRIVTGSNQITAYCYNDKPATEVQIQMKVVE